MDIIVSIMVLNVNKMDIIVTEIRVNSLIGETIAGSGEEGGGTDTAEMGDGRLIYQFAWISLIWLQNIHIYSCSSNMGHA